jgi:hypothetical protein
MSTRSDVIYSPLKPKRYLINPGRTWIKGTDGKWSSIDKTASCRATQKALGKLLVTGDALTTKDLEALPHYVAIVKWQQRFNKSVK